MKTLKCFIPKTRYEWQTFHLIPAIIAAIFLAFTFSASAQAVRTPEGKKLDALIKEIRQTELLLELARNKRSQLLTRYTDEYKDVFELDREMEILNKTLTSLNKQRFDLEQKELEKPLPNDQTELLKIIITQNREIIELLKKCNTPNL